METVEGGLEVGASLEPGATPSRPTMRGSACSPASMTAMTQADATAALTALAAVERSAQAIGQDTAALVGGLQSALHSVTPVYPT